MKKVLVIGLVAVLVISALSATTMGVEKKFAIVGTVNQRENSNDSYSSDDEYEGTLFYYPWGIYMLII